MHVAFYLGILGFNFPSRFQGSARWYCSEWVAAVLGRDETKISPQELANSLGWKGVV